MVTSGQAKLSSPKRSVVQAHVSPIVDPCHDKKPPATTASSAIQLSDSASTASKAPTATTKLPSMRCAGRTHHPDDITVRSFGHPRYAKMSSVPALRHREAHAHQRAYASLAASGKFLVLFIPPPRVKTIAFTFGDFRSTTDGSTDSQVVWRIR